MRAFLPLFCLALFAALLVAPAAESCDYGAALNRYGVPSLAFQAPACGVPAQAPDCLPGASFLPLPAALYPAAAIGYSYALPTFQQSYGFNRSFAIGASYYQRQGLPLRTFDRGFAVGAHVPTFRSFGVARGAAFAAPVLPVARVPQITQRTRTVTTTTTRQR